MPHSFLVDERLWSWPLALLLQKINRDESSIFWLSVAKYIVIRGQIVVRRQASLTYPLHPQSNPNHTPITLPSLGRIRKGITTWKKCWKRRVGVHCSRLMFWLGGGQVTVLLTTMNSKILYELKMKEFILVFWWKKKNLSLSSTCSVQSNFLIIKA